MLFIKNDGHIGFMSHHSKLQKDGWGKYIPNFALKQGTRKLGNKNVNAVWI